MTDYRLKYVDLLKDILSEASSFSSIKNDIDDKNKAFFNMLFMTTFRQLTFIKEEILPLFVKKKISKKQDILQYVLYLGIVELLFLDTPSYAIINSYVEIAKTKTDKFGANFVNAVLRNVARQKDKLLNNRKSKYFSKEFLKILRQDYSAQEIKDMEEFVNIEPMLDLTFKPSVKPKFTDYIKLDFDTIRLSSNIKVTELDGFGDGDFWVQDASSSMAVKCLSDDLTNKNVLDLCAAPGGKTAQLLSRGAKVNAIDISQDRIDILKKNIKRLNLEKNLNIECIDALCYEANDKFDIILVDAPCSATGTFRRHPEILHTKTIGDVKKMSQIQEKILDKATSLLKNNGIIIYATCSLSKAEGEVQIRKFLNKYKDFNIKEINIAGTSLMKTKEGFLRILPQHLKDFSGTDGFFVACLQRKN
ncbi:MAG: methyltransferase domain-containing protein [Alphaproteobacteria bacterium]|nr:methyltransferase domain-containing protein [Alphaproteobacteria bacterium]